MIVLNIFDEKANTKIYSFEPVRRWDFWGVCFENDNYNIWIQSGDIGIICYEYRDGEWHRSPDAIDLHISFQSGKMVHERRILIALLYLF